VALSAATVVGTTTAEAAMASVAVSTTNVMEWVLVNITDGTPAVLERLGVRSAVGAAVGDVVELRWVMAEVAARKEFMEPFLLGHLALGNLEVVIDTGLVDIGVRLTVIGVEVRLRPVRARITEANLIIIVLRTRSVFEMRVRAITILEARAGTTNLTNAERSRVEVVRAALMTVVLVVSAISSWLDEVIDGSVVLILKLRLMRHVVGLLVGDMIALVRNMVALVRDVMALAINIVSETELLLSEAAADKALETTEAIA